MINMTSIEALKRVRDVLFEELVKPGDTGFWGVGIGRGEVILYLDRSRARRVVDVPSTYVVNGEVVRVRIIEAGMPKAQNT